MVIHCISLALLGATLLPMQDLQEPWKELPRGALPELQDPQQDAPLDLSWVCMSMADITGHQHADQLRQALGKAQPAQVETALKAFMDAFKGAQSTGELLLDTIRKHAVPAFEDGATIRTDGLGSLFVSGSPEHVRWVDRFLEIQRGQQDLILVEATLFTLPYGAPSKFGIRSSSQLLEAARLLDLEPQLAKAPGSETLSMPRVLCYPRQPVQIQATKSVPYIRDYELVVVQPGDVEIADPVIDVIQEGMNMDLRLVPLGTDTHGLELSLVRSEIKELRSVETSIGVSGGKVTVSLPEVLTIRLQASVSLRLDQGLVIRTPDQAGEREYVMLLRFGPGNLATTPAGER